jgi:hypothetical protein
VTNGMSMVQPSRVVADVEKVSNTMEQGTMEEARLAVAAVGGGRKRGGNWMGGVDNLLRSIIAAPPPHTHTLTPSTSIVYS